MGTVTHDRIKLDSGLLSKPGLLWGGNALQQIQIARHTPKTPQQAVGYLGIVDYSSGVVTSDVTLDAILTENCAEAGGATADDDANHSVYRYAAQAMTIGSESYVLVSATVQLSAGQPGSMSLGFLTGTLATYLDTWAEGDANAPQPLKDGEEAIYAVVIGDDGAGIVLAATYDGAITVSPVSNIPVLDNAGLLTNIGDGSIPAGVQNISVNCRINRDQILDVRTVQPTQFVTTYPLDMTATLETFAHAVNGSTARPGETGFDPDAFRPAWSKLKTLTVKAGGLGKHVSPAPSGLLGVATEGKKFLVINGFTLVDESDSIGVGSYLRTTQQFNVADVQLPLDAISA